MPMKFFSFQIIVLFESFPYLSRLWRMNPKLFNQKGDFIPMMSWTLRGSDEKLVSPSGIRFRRLNRETATRWFAQGRYRVSMSFVGDGFAIFAWIPVKNQSFWKMARHDTLGLGVSTRPGQTMSPSAKPHFYKCLWWNVHLGIFLNVISSLS